LGAIGIVAPARFVTIARAFGTRAGLYFAAAIRLIFGIALYLAAPDTRAPETMRVLGAVIFLSGVLTLFFGGERFPGVLTWWSQHGQSIQPRRRINTREASLPNERA